MLSTDFDDFIESLELKKISQNHLVLEEIINDDIIQKDCLEYIQETNCNQSLSLSFNSSSLILTNKHKIEFAHELSSIVQLESFKEKLKNRIKRFREVLVNDQIKKIFVRIELSKIKKSYYSEINNLINLIEIKTLNYILVLIINSQENFKFDSEKIYVHKFNQFSSDWKMDFLDWSNILAI